MMIMKYCGNFDIEIVKIIVVSYELKIATFADYSDFEYDW